MTGVLLVFIGGGLGAAMRYGIILLFDSEFTPFSYAILLVNVSGSLLAGFAIATLGSGLGGDLNGGMGGESWRLFILVGILSGFTTFSAFSVETVQYLFDGRYWIAGVNILLNLLLCLIFAGLGLVGGRALIGN